VVAGDVLLDLAAPMTTIFMIAPPSEADGWRMDRSELQDFQMTSDLPWVFVQRRPQITAAVHAVQSRRSGSVEV
jgi:hypothetical protein